MNIDRDTYLLWIDDYRAGALDPVQRLAVEAYLDAHPEDRIELDRDEALLDAFDRLPRPAAPADLRGSVMARLRAERAGGTGEVDGVAAAAGTAEVVEIGERKEGGERETPAARRKGRSGIYRILQVAAVLVVCVSAWQLTRQSRERAETSLRHEGASESTAAMRADRSRADGAVGGARESAGLAAAAESEAPRQAGAEAKMKSSVPELRAKDVRGSREEGIAFDEVNRLGLADEARMKLLADEGRELAAGAPKADAGVTRGIAAQALDSAAEQPVNAPAARGRFVDSDKNPALERDSSSSIATGESAKTDNERFALRSLAAQPASAPAAAAKSGEASETFGQFGKAAEAAKAAEPDATVWFYRSSESAAPGAASAPVVADDLAFAPAQPSVDAFGTAMTAPASPALESQGAAPSPLDGRRRIEERVSEQARALAKEEQNPKAVSPSRVRALPAAEAPRGPAAAGAYRITDESISATVEPGPTTREQESRLGAILATPPPAPDIAPAPPLEPPAEMGQPESTGYPLRGGVGQLSPAASAPTGQVLSPFDQKEMTAGRAFAVQSVSMSQALDSLQGAVRAGGGSVDETVSGSVPRLRIRFRSGEDMAGFANRLRNQGWRVDETAAGPGAVAGVAGLPMSPLGGAKPSDQPVASTSLAAGNSPVLVGDKATSGAVAGQKSGGRRVRVPSTKASPASAAPASISSAQPSPVPSARGGVTASASSAFGAAPVAPAGGSVPAAPVGGSVPAPRVFTVVAPDGGQIFLDARVEP